MKLRTPILRCSWKVGGFFAGLWNDNTDHLGCASCPLTSTVPTLSEDAAMSRCTAPVNQSEKENGMKLTPFTFAQRCGIRISLSHESCDRSVCERSAQALQITLKVLTIELQNASRTPTSRRGNLLKASQQLTARPPLAGFFWSLKCLKTHFLKLNLAQARERMDYWFCS